jgi:hypothetical protein
MLLKVLVTGGRDYFQRDKVFGTLSYLKKERQWDPRSTLFIEGGAPGVDSLVEEWCSKNGFHCASVKALWNVYNKSAGPLRNSIMAAMEPDICIAFPGGPGTKDMVSRFKGGELVQAVGLYNKFQG